jgi:very-short-patch-repair endonuclease
MSRLREWNDDETLRNRRREDRAALCLPDKPEAQGDTFVALGDAALGRFGAVGIAMSPGGEQLVRNVATKNALERAALLGMNLDVARGIIEKASEHIKASLMECESPIERRLLPALVFANYGAQFLTFPAQLHFPKKDIEPPTGDIVVIPQFAFIRYRLDFAIVARASSKSAIFAIECDGKDYHSDADKDRQRDSYLNGFEIEVFRLKGSDIYADANAAAQRIADVIGHWRAAQV